MRYFTSSHIDYLGNRLKTLWVFIILTLIILQQVYIILAQIIDVLIVLCRQAFKLELLRNHRNLRLFIYHRVIVVSGENWLIVFVCKLLIN